MRISPLIRSTSGQGCLPSPGPTSCPQMTLFALGARLRRIVPLVPILSSHALGVAVASYDGQIVFSLAADRAAVPDLGAPADGIEESLKELRELVG